MPTDYKMCLVRGWGHLISAKGLRAKTSQHMSGRRASPLLPPSGFRASWCSGIKQGTGAKIPLHNQVRLDCEKLFTNHYHNRSKNVLRTLKTCGSCLETFNPLTAVDRQESSVRLWTGGSERLSSPADTGQGPGRHRISDGDERALIARADRADDQ
jgi:hypothetical protein